MGALLPLGSDALFLFFIKGASQMNPTLKIALNAMNANPLLGERPAVELFKEIIEMAKAGMDEISIVNRLVSSVHSA